MRDRKQEREHPGDKDRKEKSTLLQWWKYVTWKILSWNQKIQKYKGRVELRDNIGKDDSDAYTVFTE